MRLRDVECHTAGRAPWRFAIDMLPSPAVTVAGFVPKSSGSTVLAGQLGNCVCVCVCVCVCMHV